MISPPNLQTIEIKQKTLLGPGPCNVHERVRSVMGNTLLGHMDSDFLNIMEQVKKYLQKLGKQIMNLLFRFQEQEVQQWKLVLLT